MKISLHSFGYATLFSLVLCLTINAQPSVDTSATGLQQLPAEKGLFETDKVLEITLSGNISQVINDRAEKSKYYPMILLCKEGESNEISLPVEVKTRGHFRKQRGNCSYPPLMINFSKSDSLKSSIFKGQDKLKLVMPCQGEQYVILEWLVYKLYNLVTPKSFRTRLVSVKLDDTKKKKVVSPIYGILLEPEKQMAKRNGVIAVNRKIQPTETERDAFLTMAVFEYLIGNTDWSVQFQQNIKLLASDSNAVCTAIPYDFDHAGLVNAPYCKPAEELKMSSVKERRYRGYCLKDMKQFEQVIEFYKQLKKDIYDVYINCTLLNEKYKKNTLKFLDEFYETINNPKEWQKDFSYPCDKYGTGNIVIKGLREDE